MNKIKSGSLLPYIFYFLIGFAVTGAGLIFSNSLGVKTFALIEACLIGSTLTSYLFFVKFKRAMFFDEQSKITWVSMVILLIITGIKLFGGDSKSMLAKQSHN